MAERIELGSAPHGEECAQVGSPCYSERARAECGIYKRQLARVIAAAGKSIPEGATIITMTSPHDFGTYYEVAVHFDRRDEVAIEFAFWLEANTPEKWDAEALAEFNATPANESAS